MKSNVKVPQYSRLRARALAAMGLGALGTSCKSAPDTDGLVMVPMLESAPSAAPLGDAGREASVVTRPTLEPHAPNGQTCKRQVNCIAALATVPTLPYSHPYERCDQSPLGETGKLSPRETDERRTTEPDVCCYVSFESCVGRGARGGGGRVMIGRPLRDDAGGWIVAATSFREGWSEGGTSQTTKDQDRAAWWAASGAAEHASVAEFARLALSLLALGAPADLVEDVHRAALDEIAHARACFTLASRYAGRPVGPERLAVERATASASVTALVRDTLRDGCCGETAAAIELRAMARAEQDVELARTIGRMADDEERHAELAWRILRFAMLVDPTATSVEIGRFMADVERSPVADEIVRPCAAALVNALGRAPHEGGSVRAG